MIDKTEIRRNYHDQAIILTLAKDKEAMAGMIVDDRPADYCIFVKTPNLVEYYETKEESLFERVHFEDITAIDYQ
jgi:hypothetical protein